MGRNFSYDGPSYLYCDICGYFHPDECEGFFSPDDDEDPYPEWTERDPKTGEAP